MNKYLKIATFILCLTVIATLLANCGKSTTTPLLSASQIISKASDTLDTINSFHFVLSQTGGGTPIGSGIEMTKADGDIVRPDRLKATITGTVSGMSISVQIVSIANILYMTNPLTGSWEQPPVQFAVLSVFNPNTGITTIMKGITNLTKLGDEQSSGVICYHLSGSIDSEKLSPITGSSVKGAAIKVELWISKDDFLARNIKLTGKITDNEALGIVRTLILSKFNETIIIELPK